MKNPRVRFLVDDFLRSALVHVGMRLELKEQIQSINEEKDNTGSAADFQYLRVCICLIGFVKCCMECGL